MKTTLVTIGWDVISVERGDYTRTISVNGSADATEEAIEFFSAFLTMKCNTVDRVPLLKAICLLAGNTMELCLYNEAECIAIGT